MEKSQLLEALSVEFYLEQARHHENANSQAELLQNDATEQQQTSQVEAKLEPGEDDANDSDGENQSENDGTDSDRATVKSEDTTSGPSVILIDSDSDSEISEGEKERELQKYAKLERQALKTLQHIRDGMNALREKRAKPRRQPLATVGQVGHSSRESSVSVKRESKKMKPDEAWQKALKAKLPGEPSKAPDNVLLSITFRRASKMHLAEHLRSEKELGPVPIRMENGLLLSFANSTVEMRGATSRESRFQVLSLSPAFHIDVSPTDIIINGEMRVTGVEIIERKFPDQGFLPEHVLTLWGPEQEVIWIMFKQRRFMLTFNNNKPKLTPMYE